MTSVRFIPEDSACSIPGLNYLQSHSGKALLESVIECVILRKNIAVSDVALWRRQHPESAVASAIAVVQSRLKAAAKFPDQADRLWAVPEALEQASSARVAQYKAQRIAELAQPKVVLDLCCGIGGDMLALAGICRVIAADISAVRAWMARTNAIEFPTKYPVLVVQADMQSFPIRSKPGCFVHIDPARRSAGKRGNDFASMHPSPVIVAELMRSVSSGVIKLSPAVNFSSLPTGHLELISENGTVVQALLWTGMAGAELGENRRTATVICNGTTWSICDLFRDSAAPDELAAKPEKWLYELDGAVTRAGLAGALAHKLKLKWLSPDGGYLTSQHRIEHTALTPFAVVDDFIFTESELFRRVQALPLPSPSAAPVIEVKTRGGLGLDTNQLQKKLSTIGGRGYTVLIYRSAHGKACVIGQRGNMMT